MEPWCSVSDCFSATTSENVQFYNFPRDFDLCMLWVQNCGNSDLVKEFAYGGAQPFINRFICSKHFNNTDFVDPNCFNKGIKCDAVPKLFSDPSDVVLIKSEIQDEDDSSNHSEDNVNLLSQFIKEEAAELPDGGNTQDEPDKPDLLPLMLVSREELYLEDQSLYNLQQTKTNNAIRNAIKRANETEDERQARNEANALRNATRRANENKDELTDRLYKNAVRAAIRRSMESEDQQQERRRKNALRAAFRRSHESEEQRAERRLKDKVRSAQRRKQETDIQSKIRKYNDAIRAAFRRSQESDEQRQQRRMFDVIRAARKRSNETDEQRARRLQADRERAAKRRMLKKIKNENDETQSNDSQSDDNLLRDTSFSENSFGSSNDRSNLCQTENSSDVLGNRLDNSFRHFINMDTFQPSESSADCPVSDNSITNFTSVT